MQSGKVAAALARTDFVHWPAALEEQQIIFLKKCGREVMYRTVFITREILYFRERQIPPTQKNMSGKQEQCIVHTENSFQVRALANPTTIPPKNSTVLWPDGFAAGKNSATYQKALYFLKKIFSWSLLQHNSAAAVGKIDTSAILELAIIASMAAWQERNLKKNPCIFLQIVRATLTCCNFFAVPILYFFVQLADN